MFAILSICATAQTVIYVKVDPLTGTVVRFNKAEMDAGANGDLVVRVSGQDRFVRLIYCPSNCGIDIPLQHADALPEQMTRMSDLTWTFGVHAPESMWERNTCGSVPKILKQGKRPFEVVIEKGSPFIPTPGQSGVQVPKVETLPCFVIGKWEVAKESAH